MTHRACRASIPLIVALVSCALGARFAAAATNDPRVVVVPLLLSEPSTDDTTVTLDSLGPVITDPAQLIPGGKVHLEIWFQTRGPYGIVGAVLDVSYDTVVLDTTEAQIVINPPWTDLFGPTRFVDDATGFIKDVGGTTFVAQGFKPTWVKLATIELDVVDAPGVSMNLCTLDGGPTSGFGMVLIGGVPDEEVDYRCVCVQESSAQTIEQFGTCLSGPEATSVAGCACSDVDQDTHVDLADFAAFQRAFQGG